MLRGNRRRVFVVVTFLSWEKEKKEQKGQQDYFHTVINYFVGGFVVAGFHVLACQN